MTACALQAKTEGNLEDNNIHDTVYVIELMDEIAPHTWRKVKLGFDEAHKNNARLIIIHLNTYGGTLVDADSIRTKILNSDIPVYAFIDNNAASAGALISIACDSIYMRPGSNIGAATVVNQESEQMPDKYQSFMRSMLRATAETNNRNPKIAEAMVDPEVEIEGISSKGKVLTFTTEEAIINGYCEGKAENISEVVGKAKLNDPVVITQKLTVLDKIIGFLIKPLISGLLIMMIIGGIYFELQTPGIGLPLVIAILGVVLYFFPLYAAGLVANWEIVVFVLGFILLALEIFVIPGFGVAGISGIALMLFGLTYAMIPNNGLRVNYEHLGMLATAILTVIIAITLAFVICVYLAKKLLTTNNRHIKIALNDVQNTDQGYSTANRKYTQMINMTAEAFSILRPSGKIILNDDVYDAVTEGDWINKGESVKVVDYINGQLVVRKK
jgi:membrane-bound serine protease (ClpP class)